MAICWYFGVAPTRNPVFRSCEVAPPLEAATHTIPPTDNAVSQSLQSGAKEARAKLDPLHGAAFDRAYMDREIAYHQAVLDALDKLLIPTTDNAELKKLLTDVRPAIASHLDHAKRVRGMLGANRASR